MKLISSFVVVAAITVTVGVMGWRGVSGIAGRLDEASNVNIPGVQHIIRTQKALEALMGAQKTLLNPSLAKSEREKQYAKVEEMRAYYKGAVRRI